MLFADYHTHTCFSHGTGTPEENVQAALQRGLCAIAISEHGPAHMFYGVRKEKLLALRREVDRLAAMKIPFFLTPGYDDELVAYGLSKGMEVLPGVLTPGDVQKALNRGVRRLKLFPADAFGMSYIKSLKGPFPQAEFVAVGGVNETNVSQFLKAGFIGVAAGSNLVPRKSTDGNLELIRQKARLYVQAMEREA